MLRKDNTAKKVKKQSIINTNKQKTKRMYGNPNPNNNNKKDNKNKVTQMTLFQR